MIAPAPLRRLCVFSGSSAGARPEYREAADALGHELGIRGVALVYGGASIGLMGAVADAVLRAKGSVTGVIPQALAEKEMAHTGLSTLHIVGSMHERKARMADLADGFVALPGGWGTLDELFEVLTWAQLGLHAKPCALLNICGYFDPLLAFVAHTMAEGFVRPEHGASLVVESSPARLLDRLGRWTPPPPTTKWAPPVPR